MLDARRRRPRTALPFGTSRSGYRPREELGRDVTSDLAIRAHAEETWSTRSRTPTRQPTMSAKCSSADDAMDAGLLEIDNEVSQGPPSYPTVYRRLVATQSTLPDDEAYG